MQNSRYRAGVAEFATLAGFVAVAVVVVLALRSGWTIALIPGLIYVLATGAAYFIYRQHRAQAARVAQPQSTALKLEEHPAHVPAAPPEAVLQPAPVLFRVVDVRGTCPMGHGKGSLVAVGATGGVQPRLCAPAEAVLRMAASNGQEKAAEWCCPIYEHLLVFRRERQAA